MAKTEIDGCVIKDGGVTLADLADLAAGKIIARKSGTTGVPEACTLSELLDMLGAFAQGSILYRGTSGWALLDYGTSGHFLKTNGAGANPSWAAGGGAPAGTNGDLQYYLNGAFAALPGTIDQYGMIIDRGLQLNASGNEGLYVRHNTAYAADALKVDCVTNSRVYLRMKAEGLLGLIPGRNSSSAFVTLGGTYFQDLNFRQSVGSGDTNASTCTVYANTFHKAGDRMEIEASYSLNSTNGSVELKFGTESVFTSGTISGSRKYILRSTLLMTDVNSMSVETTMIDSAGGSPIFEVADITIDETAQVNLVSIIKGVTNDEDTTQRRFIVSYFPHSYSSD